MPASQSQTTQTTHTFVLEKVSRGVEIDEQRPHRGGAAAAALQWHHFKEPTLYCHVIEHTSTRTNGLCKLEVIIEWVLGPCPDRGGPPPVERLGEETSDGKDRSCAVLHQKFRRFQMRFVSESDLTAFLSLIENVCPLSRSPLPSRADEPQLRTSQLGLPQVAPATEGFARARKEPDRKRKRLYDAESSDHVERKGATRGPPNYCSDNDYIGSCLENPQIVHRPFLDGGDAMLSASQGSCVASSSIVSKASVSSTFPSSAPLWEPPRSLASFNPGRAIYADPALVHQDLSFPPQHAFWAQSSPDSSLNSSQITAGLRTLCAMDTRTARELTDSVLRSPLFEDIVSQSAVHHVAALGEARLEKLNGPGRILARTATETRLFSALTPNRGSGEGRGCWADAQEGVPACAYTN
ncbi:unnamed protein product [Parajaminaea phylloscopi]